MFLAHLYSYIFVSHTHTHTEGEYCPQCHDSNSNPNRQRESTKNMIICS